MNRPTKTVRNTKFGQPGEPPRVKVSGATVSDLIDELIRLRDLHGDMPVVQSGRGAWDCGDWITEVLPEDEDVFEVHLAHEAAIGVRGVAADWGLTGPVLEVRVDL